MDIFRRDVITSGIAIELLLYCVLQGIAKSIDKFRRNYGRVLYRLHVKLIKYIIKNSYKWK